MIPNIAVTKSVSRKSDTEMKKISIRAKCLCVFILAVGGLLIWSIHNETASVEVKKHLAVEPFIEGNSLLLNSKIYIPNGPTDTYFTCRLGYQELVEKLCRDNENLFAQSIGSASDGNSRYLLYFVHPDTGEKDYFGITSNDETNGELKYKGPYSLQNFNVGFSLTKKYECYTCILFPTVLIDADSFDVVTQGEKYPVIRLEQQGENPETNISDFIYNFYSASPWYEVKRGEANECIVSFDRAKSGLAESRYTGAGYMEVPYCDFSVKAERIESTCFLTVELC